MSDSLYAYRGHRQAAKATAAVILQSAPNAPGGWAASANVMHAFCAKLGVGPEAGYEGVIAAFHDRGAGIATFALGEVQADGNESWNAGNARRDELAAGRLKIRAAAIAAIEAALAD
jgi:hypothetical protein